MQDTKYDLLSDNRMNTLHRISRLLLAWAWKDARVSGHSLDWSDDTVVVVLRARTHTKGERVVRRTLSWAEIEISVYPVVETAVEEMAMAVLT